MRSGRKSIRAEGRRGDKQKEGTTMQRVKRTGLRRGALKVDCNSGNTLGSAVRCTSRRKGNISKQTVNYRPKASARREGKSDETLGPRKAKKGEERMEEKTVGKCLDTEGVFHPADGSNMINPCVGLQENC